ncbi:polyisoprenoid diphosphate/phosphate phosphohydrolase PLPP6-like isoform X2 [Dermacentor andersoni]|uniref:polyisoprenoid diphosphate/phosphate phosphohydrolase PLPP6-like isoform X2 n=1 Tax=Dermacentor andersoni TaxID=34620 RepID=UPI003B3A205A
MKRASDKVASNSNDLPGDGGDDDDTLKKRDLPPPGWKRSRLLLVMRGVDEVISSHLFLAATESSPLAKYRRMLSMFEKSAHFAIWFGGLVFLMWFFSIDVAIRTFLFNVFLAIVIDALLAAALKTVARRFRPRPCRKLYEPYTSRFTFPTAFTVPMVLVTLIVVKRSQLGFIFKALTVAWCFAASVSRLFLGRQSLGGILIGAAVASIEYEAVVANVWCSQRTASFFFSVLSALEEPAQDPLFW